MGEKRISYFEEHPSDQSGIGDDYKINIMASLRLKNWTKAIEISKRALKTFGLDYTSTDEGYLNYRRKLFCYQAVAYARLQNRDSALYYIYDPIVYQNSATDRNVFMPDQKRYLDVDELMECINVHFILNEHKKAADLAYRAIYSPYKLFILH
jgi:hypothetical protein